ncbi:MAG TPA: cytochrome c-type biogenesis protein CcmH [Terriglobia bacterium]|nr:cytochrome c-type biogenesis protein CcmH [Terriglobia bacterium]
MSTGLSLILLASSATILGPTQREVAKRAEARLLAPCCYAQPVGQHLSAEAAEMRQQIEAMAASGESEAAIVDHYKHQYGERILVVPDGETGRLLFAFSLAALAVCSAAFFYLLRRIVKAGVHPQCRTSQEETDRLYREFGGLIEQQLREWLTE